MTRTTVRWTVDDYHRMIEAGLLVDKNVELLDGEIVEMSPEGIPHADLSHEAGNYLRNLLGDRATIREAKPITLSNKSEPEPDLCICQAIRYREHHPYPEDIFWLIEYSNSSLEKDLTEKAILYATAKIREYWVVNLQDKNVIVFQESVDGRYQSREVFQEGSLRPLAFSDVSVLVKRLID